MSAKADFIKNLNQSGRNENGIRLFEPFSLIFWKNYQFAVIQYNLWDCVKCSIMNVKGSFMTYNSPHDDINDYWGAD